MKSMARLRWLLLGFFLLLAVPLAILSLKAQEQIQWESLFQQRNQSEALTQRIDQALADIIRREDARPVSDYQFLTVSGRNVYGYLQRSPLSEWPTTDAPPGLLGYFQVDDQGQLETPLLPLNGDYLRWGLSDQEVAVRSQRITALHGILSHNQLVQQRAPAQKSTAGFVERERSKDLDGSNTSTTGAALADRSSAMEMVSPQAEMDAAKNTVSNLDVQQSFESLGKLQSRASTQNTLGKLDELKLEKPLPKNKAVADFAPSVAAEKKAEQRQGDKRTARKEQVAIPEAGRVPAPATPVATLPTTPVHLFESEVDALQWIRLDSGHLLFYRKVWRNTERLVQGFVLDEATFFSQLIGDAFAQAILADYCNLVLAYRGDVVRIFTGSDKSGRYDRLSLINARDIHGTLVLQQRLSNPFSDLQLIFSVVTLPQGPGGTLITRVSLLIFGLLLVIFLWLYRVGIRQLRLAQQQQDFIASVSHELKTPLTSIRMFSEMLREGWAPAAKQKEYHDFICDESERLSRLITNVLQLARMERQELQLDIKPQSLSVLADLIRSRVQSQVARSEFELRFDATALPAERSVAADADALIQIMTNLVDNAIKFSKTSPHKIIDIHINADAKNIRFVVRDFGPGIPAGQNSKIFDLFYRIGNELTRETQGTGIGLALVQQLSRAMGGNIAVRNVQPGAEFSLTLPLLQA